MFGPWFNQVMRSRLGVGKPFEGYGMQTQPPVSLPAPNPWLQQKAPVFEIPQESPMTPSGFGGGASLPAPSPWNQAEVPQESPMKPQKQAGGMGGYKNPWQRY